MIAATVRRSVRERGLLRSGDHVLVACSGGPDSSALLHVLHGLRNELGVTLCAASIDHGLRLESAQEVEKVRAFCSALGVPFDASRVEVPREAESIQASARELRYAALHEIASARSASAIAVGHTQDDQAETILARLLRGAGLRGLSGIEPRRADGVVRPLIDCRRPAVLAYAQTHEVPFVRDPSNHQYSFERVRIRHEVMPVLELEDPRIVEHLCALGDEAAELNAHLNAQTPPLPDSGLRSVPRQMVADLVAPVRVRWLRAWIERETGLTPGRRHLTELGRLLTGPGEVLLGSGWAVRRDEGTLLLEYREHRRTRSRRS